MWSFFSKPKQEPSKFQQAFDRAIVETRGHVPYAVKNIRPMIELLTKIDMDLPLADRIFPVLLGTFSGDDLPLEIIGLFDDALPESHVFFRDDKMDVFSKSFFETVLHSDGEGNIILDTSHFDRQFKKAKREIMQATGLKPSDFSKT